MGLSTDTSERGEGRWMSWQQRGAWARRAGPTAEQNILWCQFVHYIMTAIITVEPFIPATIGNEDKEGWSYPRELAIIS